jgi:hypothetical protein
MTLRSRAFAPSGTRRLHNVALAALALLSAHLRARPHAVEMLVAQRNAGARYVAAQLSSLVQTSNERGLVSAAFYSVSSFIESVTAGPVLPP